MAMAAARRAGPGRFARQAWGPPAPGGRCCASARHQPRPRVSLSLCRLPGGSHIPPVAYRDAPQPFSPGAWPGGSRGYSAGMGARVAAAPPPQAGAQPLRHVPGLRAAAARPRARVCGRTKREPCGEAPAAAAAAPRALDPPRTLFRNLRGARAPRGRGVSGGCRARGAVGAAAPATLGSTPEGGVLASSSSASPRAPPTLIPSSSGRREV